MQQGADSGRCPEAYYDASCKPQLSGPRFILRKGDAWYPRAFFRLSYPPEALYVVGSPEALQ